MSGNQLVLLSEKMQELEDICDLLYGKDLEFSMATAELESIIRKMNRDKRPLTELLDALEEELVRHRYWRDNWDEITTNKTEKLLSYVMSSPGKDCEDKIRSLIRIMERHETQRPYMPHRFTREDLIEFYEKNNSKT